LDNQLRLFCLALFMLRITRRAAKSHRMVN
jgi:hypothetical protein